MVQQIIFPSKPLRQFVKAYVCVENTFEKNIPLPAIPRGTSGFQIDVSQKRFKVCKIQTLNGIFEWNASKPTTYIYGLFDSNSLVEVEGFTKMIMVILKPMGLHHLLRGDEKYTYNRMFNADEVLPDINNIQDQLVEAEGFENKAKLIEIFLMKHFAKSNYQESYLEEALHSILTSEGNIKVEQLAKQCGVSERTLLRKFTEQVGFSPKEYARIIRFRSVMNHLFLFPDTTWACLAYQFGYADQSHLIKDFQFFARASPEQFMQLNMEVEKHIVNAIHVVDR